MSVAGLALPGVLPRKGVAVDQIRFLQPHRRLELRRRPEIELRRRPEIVEPLGVQTAFHVIPAKAGTYATWVPAFAGMTEFRTGSLIFGRRLTIKPMMQHPACWPVSDPCAPLEARLGHGCRAPRASIVRHANKQVFNTEKDREPRRATEIMCLPGSRRGKRPPWRSVPLRASSVLKTLPSSARHPPTVAPSLEHAPAPPFSPRKHF
jgi:hypothetical protein